MDGIVPPGHVWLIIGLYNFSSEIDTTVAFGEAAMAKGFERVFVSLCDWVGGNLHVAAQIGGIGVGLRELAIEPYGVVSGQLGEYTVDCIMSVTSEQLVGDADYLRDGRTLFVNLRTDGTSSFRVTHDSLFDTAGHVTIRIAVTFVDGTLEGCALPTHVEVTVVHRTSSVTIRKAMGMNHEWLLNN